jgi:hypothetical protein
MSAEKLAIASSKLSLKLDSNFFRFKGPLWLMIGGSCRRILIQVGVNVTASSGTQDSCVVDHAGFLRG